MYHNVKKKICNGDNFSVEWHWVGEAFHKWKVRKEKSTYMSPAHPTPSHGVTAIAALFDLQTKHTPLCKKVLTDVLQAERYQHRHHLFISLRPHKTCEVDWALKTTDWFTYFLVAQFIEKSAHDCTKGHGHSRFAVSVWIHPRTSLQLGTVIRGTLSR